MPTYFVPVKWSHWGYHEVEAKDEHEAVHFAKTSGLPPVEEFLPSSVEIMPEYIAESFDEMMNKAKDVK